MASRPHPEPVDLTWQDFEGNRMSFKSIEEMESFFRWRSGQLEEQLGTQGRHLAVVLDEKLVTEVAFIELKEQFQSLEEQLEAAVAEVVDLKIAADHHKMFWQKAEERERGLKEQLQSAPKLSFCAYCGVGFEWDGKGDSCPGCKRANDLQEQLEAVTRERDERLAVNVGLIAENTELKRKLANHPVSSAARHALGEDLIPAKTPLTPPADPFTDPMTEFHS